MFQNHISPGAQKKRISKALVRLTRLVDCEYHDGSVSTHLTVQTICPQLDRAFVHFPTIPGACDQSKRTS